MTRLESLAFVRAVSVENSTEVLLKIIVKDRQKIVHSDVCGKISEKSIGGAQYFLMFTDDKSRYT